MTVVSYSIDIKHYVIAHIILYSVSNLIIITISFNHAHISSKP